MLEAVNTDLVSPSALTQHRKSSATEWPKNIEILVGAIMDIGGWLRSLGLDEYEKAFRENKVDAAVLPKLTADDLKDLGVAAVGDRRKLLEAIEGLRSATKPEPTSSEASSTAAATKDTTAERRQVTVMFSDLVGSTALLARMDPEDLREVISAYQKCVAVTVQHFGGFVAKYMGDGVLVYFGYPQAHEDDAERAVRAGLELVAAVDALKTHSPDARGHRNGFSGRGRPDRIGRFSGAGASNSPPVYMPADSGVC